jgi:hypothetical protein
MLNIALYWKNNLPFLSVFKGRLGMTLAAKKKFSETRMLPKHKKSSLLLSAETLVGPEDNWSITNLKGFRCIQFWS